ncbi:TIGR00725 family protein [Thermosulfurimonas marina]|uniref:TIGR00725 family protein n=1 Tax=Thermosulfurimonas marina TaxID=2047767 RepID=A0A6H1WQN0_9BACT|nr:TIGR00725 family protein [Thermosulfurimonas marina]QJA05468.1 TIGR00725 family protein [Thermosulfurimonas marina]
MVLRNRRRVAVIGTGIAGKEVYEAAYRVGRLLAERGAIVYTGGLGGVMEAASRGALEAGGLTVGILPGNKVEEANPYVEIPIVTDMGHARNVILIRSVEGVIAVSGGYGTLSEIALALKMWKPVFGLRTWPGIEGVTYVETPEEAVEKLFRLLEGDM